MTATTIFFHCHFLFLICAGVYYLLSILQARRLFFLSSFSFFHCTLFSWFRHGHSMQSDISILRFCSWLCEHLGRYCMRKKTSHRSR